MCSVCYLQLTFVSHDEKQKSATTLVSLFTREKDWALATNVASCPFTYT